jgi:hypothetical protein
MATAAMPVRLASIGANSALLGLIEGLADGAASFAKLTSGLYSDRLRRRKPLAVVGYLVTACSMASFGLGHTMVAGTDRPRRGMVGPGHQRLPRFVLRGEQQEPIDGERKTRRIGCRLRRAPNKLRNY